MATVQSTIVHTNRANLERFASLYEGLHYSRHAMSSSVVRHTQHPCVPRRQVAKGLSGRPVCSDIISLRRTPAADMRRRLLD